jgi:hypothetical protein
MLIQIGNEPDGFRTRYRPAAWGPADFLREWNAFHSAIAVAAPGVKFAGPDISNKLDYLTAFAAEAPSHADVVMLTGHYYAMGPAESPEATIEQLMSPDPSTTTMHANRVPIVQAAVATARLPFRMTEGNSCWNGGKAGVSDTLASALWCADAMLRFAQYGWIGVNWHGGGNGNYTAIAGSPSAGFVRRPELFGIRFAAMLTGGTFVPLAATGLDPLVTAYAIEKQGRRSVAIFNKGLAPVSVTLPKATRTRATILTGPSREATQGTELRTIRVPARRTVSVPAHSAMLYGI